MMVLPIKENFYKEKCMEKENTIGVNLDIGTKDIILTIIGMVKELIIKHLANIIVAIGRSVNIKSESYDWHNNLYF